MRIFYHIFASRPPYPKVYVADWRQNVWIFEVFCGNSDANQRCSANASQKAPHIIRASISASPFHFNPRLCRSFQSYPRKFRANSALALGAKHIRRSVSEASLMPSEFDRRNRIRSTKFFVEPTLDFNEFCGWSCATRDHEPGGKANCLSAIGAIDSTAGFEASPRTP